MRWLLEREGETVDAEGEAEVRITENYPSLLCIAILLVMSSTAKLGNKTMGGKMSSITTIRVYFQKALVPLQNQIGFI